MESTSLLEGKWLFGHPLKNCSQHGIPDSANTNVFKSSIIQNNIHINKCCFKIINLTALHKLKLHVIVFYKKYNIDH